MAFYYYFCTTLPALSYNSSSIPLSHSDFLDQASRFLSKKDMDTLQEANFYIPEDGSFPASVSSSVLLGKYYRWELGLRNELARLRAQKLQKALDRYIKPGEPEWDAMRTAQAAFQTEDPYQAELLIEKERWAYIEALVSNHFFDMESLLAYGLLLQALERKARFVIELGQKGYNEVYNTVLETADYRNESGENK